MTPLRERMIEAIQLRGFSTRTLDGRPPAAYPAGDSSVPGACHASRALVRAEDDFKAGTVSGKRIAELIATGRTPDLLKPFRFSRFAEGQLVGEKSAAAVSH